MGKQMYVMSKSKWCAQPARILGPGSRGLVESVHWAILVMKENMQRTAAGSALRKKFQLQTKTFDWSARPNCSIALRHFAPVTSKGLFYEGCSSKYYTSHVPIQQNILTCNPLCGVSSFFVWVLGSLDIRPWWPYAIGKSNKCLTACRPFPDENACSTTVPLNGSAGWCMVTEFCNKNNDNNNNRLKSFITPHHHKCHK